MVPSANAEANTLVAVHQVFNGDIAGRVLLIFPETKSLELVRAVTSSTLDLEDIIDLEQEALAETGNIILNSWVATIANLLKKNLKMSLPVVIRRDQSHIFESASPQESLILFLHIKFDISRQQIRGYVALMMDVPSVAELRSLIADYVVSLAGRGD